MTHDMRHTHQVESPPLTLEERYLLVREQVESRSCKLVAVTKGRTVEQVLRLYQKGQRAFGESRVQEWVAKARDLPEDIEWHMIGHLQKNKVKYLIPQILLIHGIDSPQLLERLNAVAENRGKKVSVLVQVKISDEQSKLGVEASEAYNFLNSLSPSRFPHVRIEGLMGMASFTRDSQKIEREFGDLSKLFERLKEEGGGKSLRHAPPIDGHELGLSDGPEMRSKHGTGGVSHI